MPALEALLSAALEREGLLGGVVETAALRRADTIKTALLRAVSHDLRSPLTAISAAGEALASPALCRAERVEMAAVIQEETRRLSRLVDNLLDLSRLEAGAAEPRRDWVVGRGADPRGGRRARGAAGGVRAVDRPRPAAGAASTPVQMERAFVNVLENARRHSGGHPVSVRARAVRSLARARAARQAARRRRREPAPAGDRVIVRIVDRGPGHPAGAARARVRALLPRRHARRRAPRLGPRAGDRPRLHRGERRHAARRVAARPGRDVRVRAAAQRRRRPGDATAARPTAPARPAAAPAPAARTPAMSAGGEGPRRRASRRPRILVVDDEPQIVRALKVVLREAGFEAVAGRNGLRGARPRGGAPAGGGDRRPRAARRRRRRGDAPAARVERDADPRALGGRRGGAEGAGRWRPAPTTTSPSRSARASSSRGCRRRCAAPGAPRRSRAIVGRRPRGRPRRAGRAPRRRADPPHPDRVRPAARAGRATAAG